MQIFCHALQVKSGCLFRAFLFFIPGLVILTDSSAHGSESLIKNPGFEDISLTLSESGVSAPAGWKLWRWKAPADIVSDGLSEEAPSEGKESAFVGVVKAGGIGWTSNSVILPSNLEKLYLKVMLKKSEDYSGNSPWIFIGWFKKDGRPIGRHAAILPSYSRPEEWSSAGVDITAADIPPGTDHCSITVGTLYQGKAGNPVSGQIFYDDVELTFSLKR